MSKSWQLQVDLPEKVRLGLNHLARELRASLGDSLHSVVLYGSSVKGEFSRNYSDVNVMLAIEPINTVVLDKVALPIRQGRRNFRLAPLLISPTDLRRSCDVFPIKFLDIQQHHKVIDGVNILDDLTIERSHLRLRCEQEFRNLLLRMRHLYLQRSFYNEQFEMTLLKLFSSLLIGIDALLYLREGKHFVNRHKIIAASTEYLSIPQEPLARLLQLRLGRWRPTRDQLKQSYEDLMRIVEVVANIADRMEEEETEPKQAEPKQAEPKQKKSEEPKLEEAKSEEPEPKKATKKKATKKKATKKKATKKKATQEETEMKEPQALEASRDAQTSDKASDKG